MEELSSSTLLLSVAQTYRALGIGRTYLYQLMREGKLKYVQVGRRRLVPRHVLDQFIESLEAQSA